MAVHRRTIALSSWLLIRAGRSGNKVCLSHTHASFTVAFNRKMVGKRLPRKESYKLGQAELKRTPFSSKRRSTIQSYSVYDRDLKSAGSPGYHNINGSRLGATLGR